MTIDYAYLVFDPERKSHRRAEEVHRWDDWTLRHQARFQRSWRTSESFLRGTDLIVAHNAEFDLRFVARELAIAGPTALEAPFYCTLQGLSRRQLWPSVARRDLPAIWLAAFQHA